MTWSSVLTWIAVVSSALLLAQAEQARPPQRSWSAVSLAVLVLSLSAYGLAPGLGGYLAGVLWLGLLVVPSQLLRRAQAAAARHDFTAAVRLVRGAYALHPSRSLALSRAQLSAQALARTGQQTEAELLLEPLAQGSSAEAAVARAELLRLRGDWRALRDAVTRNTSPSAPLSPAVLGLRALGECGERGQLVACYRALLPRLSAPRHETWHDMARLYLFAFTGRTEQVQTLCAARLASTPQGDVAFWLATAARVQGDEARARTLLEPLVAAPDPLLRAAACRRLEHALPSEPAGPDEGKLLEDETLGLAHEIEHALPTAAERRRAPVTWTFLAAIALTAALQVGYGALSDPQGMYELGALWTPAVLDGDGWWRVLSFQFLYAGALHLLMNALGLFALGRAVEPKLGALRTLLVYAGSGTAAGLTVVLASLLGAREPALLVGASGGLMGLVGALMALALRALRARDTPKARSRVALAALTVGAQVAFDLATPEVSGLAHLGGFAAGLLLTGLVGVPRAYARPTTRGARTSPPP